MQTNQKWKKWSINGTDVAASILSLVIFADRAINAEKLACGNTVIDANLYRTFKIHIFLGSLTVAGSIGVFFAVLFLDILANFIACVDSTMNCVYVLYWLLHVFCVCYFICLFFISNFLRCFIFWVKVLRAETNKASKNTFHKTKTKKQK